MNQGGPIDNTVQAVIHHKNPINNQNSINPINNSSKASGMGNPMPINNNYQLNEYTKNPSHYCG
jgi:hypothetical protein